MKIRGAALIGLTAVLPLLSACRKPVETVRIGYETNLAASPALLGIARNDFGKTTSLPVRARAFNAGPGVVDALFNNEIDFAYLDPVSAVGAYVRSRGKFVIIAGAAMGGAALVVSTETAAGGVEGLREARVATPQVASESDVEARQFFSGKGFMSREQGGEFQIVPIANLDLIRVFRRRDVAAAWTIEPWIADLEQAASGVRLIVQADVVEPAGTASDPSCVVVARRQIVEKNPKVVAAFLRAHVVLVNDIASDRDGSRALAVQQLSKMVGRSFDDATLARAWPRLSFSSEIPVRAVTLRALDAFRIGYLGASMPDLQPAFDDAPLKAVSREAPAPGT